MRLLIQADEKGDLNGCILQYLPTEKFSGVMEAVNWATAGQLKFDGLLLLKNLDDGFLGGISLKEGRVYSKKVSRSNVSNTHNGVSLRLQDECYPTYYWLCTGTATYGTTCRIEQGPDYCVPASSSGGGGGGDVFGGGGSGSGGSGSSGSSSGGSSGAPHSAEVHCSSFSFRPTTQGSNPSYQGSTVQGIRMFVKDIDNHKRTYFITATYYIPTVTGDGNILTAKNATEIATEATNTAKDATEDHFAGAYVNSTEFTNYFMNELRTQLASNFGSFATVGQSNNALLVTKGANQYYWDDFEYWKTCN